MDDVSGLKSLGQTGTPTEYLYQNPNVKMIETFPNKAERAYSVLLEFPEFTSLCPKTGQPDFGTIAVRYSPGKSCLESKSMKLYFFAYRDFRGFMESIVNKVLNDVVQACDPRFCRVTGVFAPRGGIKIVVKSDYYGTDDDELFEGEETH